MDTAAGMAQKFLALLLEHPAGGRVAVALSDPFAHDDRVCRVLFSMDPSGWLWAMRSDLAAEQAFRSSSRESDGYVVQREYLIGTVPVPGDAHRRGRWWEESMAFWFMGRLHGLLTIHPRRWVQGHPVEGDTRFGAGGRSERYTSGCWELW